MFWVVLVILWVFIFLVIFFVWVVFVLTMASFEELKKQAIDLGLSGTEVGKYVIQQQVYEREERAVERQARQEEAERQARQEEAERQERLEIARLAAETECVCPRKVSLTLLPSLRQLLVHAFQCTRTEKISLPISLALRE